MTMTQTIFFYSDIQEALQAGSLDAQTTWDVSIIVIYSMYCILYVFYYIFVVTYRKHYKQVHLKLRPHGCLYYSNILCCIYYYIIIIYYYIIYYYYLLYIYLQWHTGSITSRFTSSSDHTAVCIILIYCIFIYSDVQEALQTGSLEAPPTWLWLL